MRAASGQSAARSPFCIDILDGEALIDNHKIPCGVSDERMVCPAVRFPAARLSRHNFRQVTGRGCVDSHATPRSPRTRSSVVITRELPSSGGFILANVIDHSSPGGEGSARCLQMAVGRLIGRGSRRVV